MNFKNLFLVIGMALLSSCSTLSSDDGKLYNPRQSEEFGSYLRLFRTEAAERNITVNYEGLRVYFVDKFPSSMEQRGVIGYCDFQSDKQIIMVRKPSWDSYDSLQREMLIFHEMGHCILDQSHDESTDFESVPTDLMYPSNFPSFYYAKERTEYLDRMFEKIKKELKDKEAGKLVGSAKRRYFCRWGHLYKPPTAEELDKRSK